MRLRRFVPLALICALAACGPAPDEEGFIGDLEETSAAADGKADRLPELRARVTGLTVWMSPYADFVGGPGFARRYKIAGRASRDLGAVQSWVPDDGFGRARIVSARKFEIDLDDHELNTLLSGMPLFVTVTPKSGPTGTAAVWLAPRLEGFSGASAVSIRPTLLRVWTGGELVYRNRANVGAGWSSLTVSNAVDALPQVVEEKPRYFRLDWRFDALRAAWEPAAGPLTYHAYRGGEEATKRTRIAFLVEKLGLTTLDAAEVWQEGCLPEVRRCLAALPPGVLDAEACGTFREVQRCGGPVGARQPDPAQLAADLRAHLAAWYADHGADVLASGGSTLAEAQAAVDPEAFSEVGHPDENPMGHDLTRVWLFRHPDVVWPGSDIVWFVVYDRATGALVEAYDFN